MSEDRGLLSTATRRCQEDNSDYAVQKAQGRKICLRKFLICICVLLFILLAAGVAVGVLFGTTNQFKNKKHTPPPGNITNSKVLDYIDTSKDPCDNFYKYSCGNWRNSRPGAPEWGTFEDLALDNYNKLVEYLSRYARSSDPDAIKKAKNFYSACTNTNYICNNYVEEVKNFMINKGGGWENGGLNPYKSWSINSNLSEDHYLGSSAFFSFEIFPDDLDSSKPVIKVIYITIDHARIINYSLLYICFPTDIVCGLLYASYIVSLPT